MAGSFFNGIGVTTSGRSSGEADRKINGPNGRRRAQVAVGVEEERSSVQATSATAKHVRTVKSRELLAACFYGSVNSSLLQTNSGFQSWACSLLESPNGASVCTAQHGYDITRPNFIAMHPVTSPSPTYSAHSGFDSDVSAESPTGRPSCSTGYYEDTPMYGYQCQYPAPGAQVGNVYESTASSKEWRASARINSTNGTMYPDSDGASTLSTSISFITKSPQVSTSSDGVAHFPTMGSSSGPDRTLPNPAFNRSNVLCPVTSIVEGPISTSATACPATATNAPYRQPCQWGGEAGMTQNGLCSGLACTIPAPASPPNNSNTVSVSAPEFGFPYPAFLNTLSSSVSAAPFVSTDLVDSGDCFQTGESQTRRYLASGSPLPGSVGSMQTYRHSTNDNNGSQPPPMSSPTGMLSHEQAYGRPHHRSHDPNQNSDPRERFSHPPPPPINHNRQDLI
ncbi:hypothetical protein FQN57_000746 [Myotisia sp. PD_48]|nr:hypothetical protein FQN57_000746 [Myotisia sp. PD_48]